MYDVHSIFLFHESQETDNCGPEGTWRLAVAAFPERGQGWGNRGYTQQLPNFLDCESQQENQSFMTLSFLHARHSIF